MNDSTLRLFGTLVLGFANDDGTAASITLDSSSVFYTSGDCWYLRFISPVTQASANLDLYLYCTAVTGAPTLKAALRAGPTGAEDDDRPSAGGSELATTASDVTPVVNTWDLYRIASATLTEGNTYFILLYNTHATPDSNNAAIQYSAALDTPCNATLAQQVGFFRTGYSNDTFATDGTLGGSVGCGVLKFADGTYLGNPYVADDSAHANNQNYRGMRITLPTTYCFCGISGPGNAAAISNVGIWSTAGTQMVISSGFDRFLGSNFAGSFFAKTKLPAGTYDFLFKYSANATYGTIYTMGEAEGDLPADVLACRSFSGAYIDGANVGSLTIDTSKAFSISLWINDIPHISVVRQSGFNGN
jgi:hypothetical protein